MLIAALYLTALYYIILPEVFVVLAATNTSAVWTSLLTHS